MPRGGRSELTWWHRPRHSVLCSAFINLKPTYYLFFILASPPCLPRLWCFLLPPSPDTSQDRVSVYSPVVARIIFAGCCRTPKLFSLQNRMTQCRDYEFKYLIILYLVSTCYRNKLIRPSWYPAVGAQQEIDHENSSTSDLYWRGTTLPRAITLQKPSSFRDWQPWQTPSSLHN